MEKGPYITDLNDFTSL